MITEIPGMRGSAVHELSVVIHKRHVDAGQGRCDCCGLDMPCPARQNSALVRAAAGEGSRGYERTNDSRNHSKANDDTVIFRALRGRDASLDGDALRYAREAD